MYEAYWKLSRRPFESGASTRAYYPSEPHQGALLKLRYAIEHEHAAALLAGAPGTGKTLIVQLLSEQLPERFRPVVQLLFPQMPAADLLAYLAGELCGGGGAGSIAENVARIEHELADRRKRNRHTVLAVDDAQLLESSRTFDTLRLLLNLEADGRPLLTILLVGQPTLLPMLERMPHLDERLGAKCLVRPLNIEETMSYVSHRMTVAGSSDAVFEPSALETLFLLSRGVPRRINRLCDLALLVGFAEEHPTITAEHIEAVAKELAVAAVE
ncbi:MAG TPA: AAA family ATPase [Pirellulales bacterium]|nr:AAA family ATPase [Pirellulales bacterium]